MGYEEKKDGDLKVRDTGMGINRGGVRRRRWGDTLCEILKSLIKTLFKHTMKILLPINGSVSTKTRKE